MWDLSDTYVSQGESGGLLALVFFVAIITRSFSRIGKARKAAAGRKREWFMWLIGTALYANVMAFFGVSYWDQTEVVGFALLAMISVATEPALAGKSVPKKAEVRVQSQPAMASTAGA
jgi:hypothetical protein